MKKETGVILLAGAVVFGTFVGEEPKHIQTNVEYPQPNAEAARIIVAAATTSATAIPFIEGGGDGIIRLPFLKP